MCVFLVYIGAAANTSNPVDGTTSQKQVLIFQCDLVLRDINLIVW